MITAVWIVGCIVGYFAVAMLVTYVQARLGFTGEDSPIVAIFWPAALPVVVLAPPIIAVIGACCAIGCAVADLGTDARERARAARLAQRTREAEEVRQRDAAASEAAQRGPFR